MIVADSDRQKQIFVSKEQDRGGLDPVLKSGLYSQQFEAITGRGARNGAARHEPRRSAFARLRAARFRSSMAPEDTRPRTITTVLLPAQVGKIWRVQIVWPNGSVHYFGNFARQQDAADWITSHSWLTAAAKPPTDPPP